VEPGHHPPLVHFTTCSLSPTGGRPIVQPRLGDGVWFDVSELPDGDGNVVRYEWDWDYDGSFDTGFKDAVIGHVFSRPGADRVTLKLTAAAGDTASDGKEITVNAAPPGSPKFHPFG